MMDEEEISELTDLDNTHLKVLELSKRIWQREFKKWTMGKCTFNMTDNMKIGFKFFNLVKTVTKPATKFVNASNNK